MEFDAGVEVSSGRSELGGGGDVKLRRGVDEKLYNGTGEKEGRGGKVWELERSGVGKEENVKHYDADGMATSSPSSPIPNCLLILLSFFHFPVLTKVIVYSGIAVLACEVLPVMFEVLGWGVKSW